ncbi:hypothetical protein [Bosea sp. PAMC 26642]|uniref:hypothetical protein n=1 Tax=Bosea sp. (strain PAMC 26642) TaxID=1792307 RepID=UPI00077024D1|nr:hypothetical protein [Bosea sp. PAMC 26642]AMJ61084.1 hypothetical protein AXW83_12995 [Bosea sp. PAMC 26642]
MMRIAFVIQSHKCLVQIEHLVQRLQGSSQNHVVVISHDGTSEEVGLLSQLRGVTKAFSAVGGRGSFGLVDGFLKSLRWLYENEIEYDWLVMMSGQDYLVRPLADLEFKLSSSHKDGYYYHFRADDLDEATSGIMSWPLKESRDRYYFQ